MGGVKNKAHNNRKKRTKKKKVLPFACGRKNVRKDDFGPHPDDDDLSSRLNKRVYYLFFKKKKRRDRGRRGEEDHTRDDSAIIGFLRHSPERVYAWCVYFLDFR